MTRKNAIKLLREQINETFSVEVAEAFCMAISALEKQEGKKPNNRSGWPGGGRDTADGNCPVCDSPLVCTTPRYYSKHEYYCRDCGQRIDWSDEHDTD